jgi:hypothetical protein
MQVVNESENSKRTFKNHTEFFCFYDASGVTCGGDDWCIKRFGGKSLKKIDTFGDLRVDGMMIMKLIFKKWDGTWTGLVWFRIGRSDGPW